MNTRPPLPQPRAPHVVQKAAALNYDEAKAGAPRLTAKGAGAVAERIIALAKEHNIPIHADADLVEILEKVELDTEIPLEVYAVVAEVFAYLYKSNRGTTQAKGQTVTPQMSQTLRPT